MAVFYDRERIHCNLSCLSQVVLAHPPNRFPFSGGPSGNVFQLPDMTADGGVFQGTTKEAFCPLTFYWELFLILYEKFFKKFF